MIVRPALVSDNPSAKPVAGQKQSMATQLLQNSIFTKREPRYVEPAKPFEPDEKPSIPELATPSK